MCNSHNIVLQREEEKLRQSVRKETKVKRARERGANSSLSSSYLEPEREDGSDDENAISLSAIKNKFNKKSVSKGMFFFPVYLMCTVFFNKLITE